MPNTMSRIELYLLKKKLRLESSRLVQGAKVSLPIIQASKLFKNCVGASLRTRQMNRRRESIISVEKSRLRFCQYVNDEEETNSKSNDSSQSLYCKKSCLPMSNFCLDHTLFNIEQKLFSYCVKTCCRKPVLCTDAILFNGLCRQHFEENNLPTIDLKSKVTIASTLPSNNSNANTSFAYNRQPSVSYQNTIDNSSKAVNQGQYHYSSSYYPDHHASQNSGLSSNCFYNDHPTDQLNDDGIFFF